MSNLIDIDMGKYWDLSINPICHMHCRVSCECGRICWANFAATCLMKNKADLVDGAGVMFDLPVMNQIPLDGEPLVYFVCSLSDIGHPAITKRYVNEVFSVMDTINLHREQPHTFLVLTKWPHGLYKQLTKDYPNCNAWVGATITGRDNKIDQKRLLALRKFKGFKTLVSVEPLYNKLDNYTEALLIEKDQVIIGHASGERCNGSLEHVDSIVRVCRAIDTPVFVKQLHIDRKLSKYVNDWPENLRVRELAWG